MRAILAAALLFISAALGGGAEARSGTLTVKASGFRSETGKAVAALFISPEGFPSKGEKAFRREYAEIRGGAAVFVFSGLPYGRYAVSVLHDENSNGRLDATWLGLPREGVGASNDPASRLGPPSFKAAAFELLSEKMQIGISVRYRHGN